MDPQNQTPPPVSVDDTVIFTPPPDPSSFGDTPAPSSDPLSPSSPPSTQDAPTVPEPPVGQETPPADQLSQTGVQAKEEQPAPPDQAALPTETPQPTPNEPEAESQEPANEQTEKTAAIPALPLDEPKVYQDQAEPEAKSQPLDPGIPPAIANQTDAAPIEPAGTLVSSSSPQSPSLLDPNRFYPIGEAAVLLGVSIDTLRRWEQKGQIQAERSKGQLRRFSGKVLQDYLAHQASDDRLISVSEAAKELGVSIQTLRRWDKSGRLRAERASDGARMYQLRAIRELKATGLPHDDHQAEKPHHDHRENRERRQEPKPRDKQHKEHHNNHPNPPNPPHYPAQPADGPDSAVKQERTETIPGPALEQPGTSHNTLEAMQETVDNLATSAFSDHRGDQQRAESTDTSPVSDQADVRTDDTPPTQPDKSAETPVDLSPLTKRLDRMANQVADVRKQLDEMAAKVQVQGATVDQLVSKKDPVVFHPSPTPAAATPPEFDTTGSLTKPGVEDHGNANTGQSILHKGTNKVVIKTRAAKEGAAIYLTAVTPTVQQLAAPIVIPNEGFAVATAQPVSVDLQFNWLVIN